MLEEDVKEIYKVSHSQPSLLQRNTLVLDLTLNIDKVNVGQGHRLMVHA